MRLLLDTHVNLWWLQDHPKLSKAARAKIVDASEVYVSSASIWEASIKAGIGKLDANINKLETNNNQKKTENQNSDKQEKPKLARHAAMVSQLPDLLRDPFDRML